MERLAFAVGLTLLRARQGERLAFAVGLTLLRARQGERLAFAFANALAKRDISRTIAHPLIP